MNLRKGSIMKQETRAVLEVAKLFTIGATGGLLTMLALAYIPLNVLGLICGGLLMGYMTKLVYDINLAQIQYRDKLKEMVDQK